MKSSSSKADPLAVLEVIDTLEIGPVKLSRNSLKMNYTILQHGKKYSVCLIYSYPEKVFLREILLMKTLRV